MRLTLIASLVVCGSLCTGCESLNKTVRNWPNKNPAMSEQLALDQQRRDAAGKQVTTKDAPKSDDKTVQPIAVNPTPPAVGDTADTPLLRAKQAEQARQNQVAKSLYEQVLQQQPQNPEAHHRLGVLADQDGRYADAQQHYQMALQQQPQNASLLSDIGYSYYSQDRLNEAEQYLTQSLRIQPENQYARNNLAQVYGRRAQQTGSPNDYKLAKEQFTLALGAQGAEQQMQQILPPASGGASDRKGLLNPFKKLGGQDKTTARTGSNLQAPDPKLDSGNAELLRQMEQIRAQMAASGELPQKRPEADPARQGTNPPPNVPFDQMNSELSRIDLEASRQQAMAMRQAYPAPQRSMNQTAQDEWNSSNAIEQTSAQQQQFPVNSVQSRANPGEQQPVVRADGYPSAMPNTRNPAAGWDQTEPMIMGQRPTGSRGRQADGAIVNGGNSDLANGAEGQDQSRSADLMGMTWPDPHGSPTQFDARGQTWDGNTIMSNPGRNNSANPAYEANDPTYYSGNGQSFGTQRPNSQAGPRGNARGRPRTTTPGWDDGRQTAAQLGLDSGMGDMFPGGAGEAEAGYGENGGNWNYPAGTDPGMSGNTTTRRGMPAGGAGNIAPADYRAAPPSYQYNGYSQGVNPGMGENYGNAGGDVSAPWNQPASTSPSNSRSASQLQYPTDGGQTQGRFAPSRRSSASTQNFGAPPMYYGR